MIFCRHLWQIKLGDKILTELDLPHKFRVITTQTTIFISSPAKLIAFDLKGSEIGRTNPQRKIQFGSVGEDPNTVYGLDDNMLLRIYMENGSLNIQNVYDLSESKWILHRCYVEHIRKHEINPSRLKTNLRGHSYFLSYSGNNRIQEAVGWDHDSSTGYWVIIH